MSDVITGSVTKKIINKKFILVGLVILCVVVIVVSILLLASGRVAVVSKKPAERVLLVGGEVCADDTITTYNKVSRYQQRNGSTEDTLDAEGLKSLVTGIQQKTGYQEDPTCQTIMLIKAIHDNDYQAAQKAYEAVKRLHAKQLYADSNLNGVSSLSTYESLVESIAPPNKDGANQEAQGGA